MKMIVGLGNPGREFENTKHNIGFIVLNNLFNEKWKSKYESLYLIKEFDNEKIVFLKPQTYMNLSGNAVKKFANFYKINTNDILVIHDDLDLPFGKIRIKYNSSAGGHNGIKSIISSLNSNEFYRLKIGISKFDAIDIKDYVLMKLSLEELNIINNSVSSYKEIINLFIKGEINKATNKFN